TYGARSSRRLLKAAERMIRRKKKNSELLRSASTYGMSYPAARIGQSSLTLADCNGSSVRVLGSTHVALLPLFPYGRRHSPSGERQKASLTTV
ncbi:unnamed protein product, partial [marine sediment metagenome]